METGNFAQGLEAYQDLLSRSPDDVETLVTLAGLYEEIDDEESSRYIYEKVIELDPQNEVARKGLAG